MPPTLKDRREAALKAARDLATKAEESGEFSAEDRKAFDDHLAEAEGLTQQMKNAEADQARLQRIGALTPEAAQGGQKAGGQQTQKAATLGDHFAMTRGEAWESIRGQKGASVVTPEWNPQGAKAATDTQVTGAPNSVWQTPVLTEFDRTVVRPFQPRLVVADLLGSGVIGSDKNAVSYFIEGALEGAFTTVAEGAAKPQLHFVDPTLASDALRKIAGFIKNTDEMLEDLQFYVTEINNRLVLALQRFEETQLLSGNGTGTNILGLLNRSGIQTETAAAEADNADAFFRAITKISTATGLDADGIMIHPTDYQALRLKKDENGQYYGGGFFSGQYGVNGFSSQPPLWGLRTVVTPAVAAGTAVVGAFSQAATVYRKGGIRVESTNSHATDFTSNLVTTRAEERIALAVRYPAAVVKVTLSGE